MIPNLPLLLARLPKAQDRAAMRDAHEAAGEFHAARARVLDAEIERDVHMHGEDSIYWESERQSALGAAAVAMEKMPLKWLAVLEVATEK